MGVSDCMHANIKNASFLSSVKVLKVPDSDRYGNSCHSCHRDDSSVSSCNIGGNDRSTIESLSKFVCLSTQIRKWFEPRSNIP